MYETLAIELLKGAAIIDRHRRWFGPVRQLHPLSAEARAARWLVGQGWLAI